MPPLMPPVSADCRCRYACCYAIDYHIFATLISPATPLFFASAAYGADMPLADDTCTRRYCLIFAGLMLIAFSPLDARRLLPPPLIFSFRELRRQFDFLMPPSAYATRLLTLFSIFASRQDTRYASYAC